MKKLKRLLYSLTIVVTLVFMLPPIQANAEDWTTYTVHVTKTGSKYHRAGCSYLKSDIPINILDAVNKGYTPCSRCNPPYPTVANTTPVQESAVQSTQVQSAPANIQNNNTITITYDMYGNPIQDTIYRGYYSNYSADYNQRMNTNNFQYDILFAAQDAASYDYLSEDEKDIYAAISNLDREEFIIYKVMDAYYYYLNMLVTYSPVCDPYYYASLYPEKGQMFNNDRLLLLYDFITYGMSQGLQGSPTFNVYTYINNNPDLVAVFGNDLQSYYIHYINNGRIEGRIAY